jgi:hypothetical protein
MQHLQTILGTAPACMPAVTGWITRRYKSGNRFISADGVRNNRQLAPPTAAASKKTINAFIFNSLRYSPRCTTGRHLSDFAKLHKERIRWIDVFL